MNGRFKYFSYGDGINAKQLYYFTKKHKLQYPFTRAYSKAILIDHKITVAKVNQNSRYGLITVEESLGHIVPGILFELHEDSDLSIFSNEFEEVYVQAFPSGEFIKTLINKREKRNVLDIEKAKLSKGRKKTMRQAIKWRNLEDFEACYESALCNYLYPYMVKNFFFDSKEDLMKVFNANEYTSTQGNINGEQGYIYYSNHLAIKNDIKKFDNYFERPRKMVQVEVEGIGHKGKNMLAWATP